MITNTPTALYKKPLASTKGTLSFLGNNAKKKKKTKKRCGDAKNGWAEQRLNGGKIRGRQLTALEQKPRRQARKLADPTLSFSGTPKKKKRPVKPPAVPADGT